jgi:hypothetical protein
MHVHSVLVNVSAHWTRRSSREGMSQLTKSSQVENKGP